MGIKSLFLSFSLVFFAMCEKNSDDDTNVENCAAVTCLAQTMSIELVNAEGTNLIEDGSYSLADITVFKGDDEVTMLNTTSYPRIVFFLVGAKGKNTCQVRLNASETDTLILNLTEDGPKSFCCGPYFIINDAEYNGNTIEIVSNENLGFSKIVVVKP